MKQVLLTYFLLQFWGIDFQSNSMLIIHKHIWLPGPESFNLPQAENIDWF